MAQISEQLTSNAYSGIIAEADKIAYSTKLDLDNIKIMDKSVKAKIDEINNSISNLDIQANANNIVYKEETANSAEVTVKDELDSVNTKINNLQSSTDAVLSAKTAAINASLIALLAAQNALDSANSLNNLLTKVNEIKEVADAFATGFDADANFVILSETQYNNLPANDLSENCIYFCYE